MALQRARGDPLARLVFLTRVRSTQSCGGGVAGRNVLHGWEAENDRSMGGCSGGRVEHPSRESAFLHRMNQGRPDAERYGKPLP